MLPNRLSWPMASGFWCFRARKGFEADVVDTPPRHSITRLWSRPAMQEETFEASVPVAECSADSESLDGVHAHAVSFPSAGRSAPGRPVVIPSTRTSGPPPVCPCFACQSTVTRPCQSLVHMYVAGSNHNQPTAGEGTGIHETRRRPLSRTGPSAGAPSFARESAPPPRGCWGRRARAPTTCPDLPPPGGRQGKVPKGQGGGWYVGRTLGTERGIVSYEAPGASASSCLSTLPGRYTPTSLAWMNKHAVRRV